MLISNSKESVYHISKHLDARQEYSATRRISTLKTWSDAVSCVWYITSRTFPSHRRISIICSSNRERIRAVGPRGSNRPKFFPVPHVSVLLSREYSLSLSHAVPTGSLSFLKCEQWYFIYIFVEISALDCARLSVLFLEEPGTTCPPFPDAMTQSVRRNRSFIIV